MFIDTETVRAHQRLYAASGRGGVARLAYIGHAPVLTPEQMAKLSAELSARLCLTAKVVCDLVARCFALSYTPPAMARLLGRIGFVWKHPKLVPAKADADAQQAFLDGTLLPLIAAAEADPAQPLLFVDATHPAYSAHPASGWIRRGATVMRKSNHGRARVTLNGALSWPARAVITREAQLITGAEMIVFFEQIAQRYPLARTITLVLDNATYNRAALVREWPAQPGCWVRLVYLPPYAPNLDLIERLWRFFKTTTPSNTYYPTLADFRPAIKHFFENIDQGQDNISALITKTVHLIGTQPSQIPRA